MKESLLLFLMLVATVVCTLTVVNCRETEIKRANKKPVPEKQNKDDGSSIIFINGVPYFL